MNSVANTTEDSFWTKCDKMSDKRTRGWLLVDSPIDVAWVVLAYFIMVWLGPKIMKRRKPFKIKSLLIIYNFSLVLLNTHIVREMFMSTTRLDYRYLCNPSRNDFHPEELRLVSATWWFYTTKYLEFMDTLFFILRKKNDQLTPLHIYHHGTIFPLTWLSIKWFPGGAAIRLQMLNSCVHIIMYSYYGLSALGPQVQKYLWWKKYLTSFQLVQFVISLLWSLYSINAACNHPLWVDLLNILYMCSFLVLFGKFYMKKYTKKKVK